MITAAGQRFGQQQHLDTMHRACDGSRVLKHPPYERHAPQPACPRRVAHEATKLDAAGDQRLRRGSSDLPRHPGQQDLHLTIACQPRPL
jgi:hypothetical protein